MIKITKNIGIGIVIFALVLSFLSGMLTAKAKADLNTMIANVAGTIMGNGWVDSNVEDVSEDRVGSVGDTQSSMKIASIEMDMSTVTPGILYNDSSRDRFVTKVSFVMRGGDMDSIWVAPTSDGYDPRVATSALAFYSADESTSGTMASWTNIVTTTPTMYSTSTLDNLATANGPSLSGTTTPIWNTGSYLHLDFNDTLSTTSEGIFVVEYYTLP